MSNKETDISQIRKYLKGELDAHAMYELERRAQDDPFLMDALEGYEHASAEQQANLNELSERLQQRIDEKKKRIIIPWQTISIAAMVLMFLIIGTLLFTRQENKPKIALNTKPDVVPTLKDTSANTVGKAPDAPVLESPDYGSTLPAQANEDLITAQQSNDRLARSKATANMEEEALKRDSITKLNEVVVTGYATQRKTEIMGSVATVTDKPVKVDSMIQGQAAGVAVAKSAAPGAASDIRIRGLSSVPSPQIITGKVIAKEDGLPIPGVSVMIRGTRTGTQTDINGNFALHVDTINTKLQIAYIGYKSKQVNIGNNQGPLDITLEASSNSLNEVVVSGISNRDKEDTQPIYAHPEDGWNSFNKYLKANSISPDGQVGKVKLSFVVDGNGDITDIKVINGLSDATNKKAISLIENGPSWKGNSNGQPEKITVKIKFEKKK